MPSTQVSPESGQQQPNRVIAAADVNDVMREQLDYLIEHAQAGTCECSRCLTYLRVRSLLLQTFD